jgi:hypothetical protein
MIPGDPRPCQEVLKAECVAEYKTMHTDIYHRLIQIDTSIEILETIASFPLKHLLTPDDPFFTILYWNFTYTCVVMLHALLKESESLGIPRFRKHLIRDWLPEHEQEALRGHLRTARFSKTAQCIRRRVAATRDKVIAHRDSQVATHPLKIPGVTIGDSRAPCNETEALFAACCFAVEYGTTLYPPGTVGGRPAEKDIERFMRLLLRDSEWLMQPEREGRWWVEMRKRMPQADLHELNRWRVQLGLPEA